MFTIEIFLPFMPHKSERGLNVGRVRDGKGGRKVRTDAAKEAIFERYTRHADAKMYREARQSLTAAYSEAKAVIFAHFAKQCGGDFATLNFTQKQEFTAYMERIRAHKAVLLNELQATYFATTAKEARAAEKATAPVEVKASDLWSNF